MPRLNEEGLLRIDGAEILFPNFKGAPTKYKKDGGERHFDLVIPEHLYEQLKEDGWNIKRLRPRDTDDPNAVGKAHMKVKVAYKVRPPKIYMLTSRKRTLLGEDTVAVLDMSDIVNVDLIVAPYEYDNDFGQGIAAYVRTMFVKVYEDELERKYADVPDAEIDQPVF